MRRQNNFGMAMSSDPCPAWGGSFTLKRLSRALASPKVNEVEKSFLIFRTTSLVVTDNSSAIQASDVNVYGK